MKYIVTINEYTNKGYNKISYPEYSNSKKELIKKLRGLYPNFMTKIKVKLS